MSKDRNATYSWEEIENDIREAVLAFASMIAFAGPDEGVACTFLGIDKDQTDWHTLSTNADQAFPVERHKLYKLAVRAYDHAYQLGDVDFHASGAVDPFNEESYEVLMILQGYPRSDQNGDFSPFEPRSNSPLRNMLETAYARWELEHGNDLSIRQLALLSNMTLPAVRTSISKEGIKTKQIMLSKEALKSLPEEERLGRVASENALSWLRGRRGFIPTISTAGTARMEVLWPAFLKPGADIMEGVQKAIKVLKPSIAALASEAEVEGEWLEGLLGDTPVALDLDALQRLAKALRAPTPAFVGGLVQELLVRQSNA